MSKIVNACFSSSGAAAPEYQVSAFARNPVRGGTSAHRRLISVHLKLRTGGQGQVLAVTGELAYLANHAR